MVDSPQPHADSATFAFATDTETGDALREGLIDRPNAQVWQGAVRDAIEALERAPNPAPQLIFVDLDESSYPAGAIHELAAVCEVGTAVVAIGSDDTARFSREILLAGVSDYLVKPVTVDAVRAAADRAVAPPPAAVGRAVAFAGTGGSGVTTLAVAVALAAAEQGRYVAALDLNRLFPALPFQLDVEPASGLDQLLDAAAGEAAEPEMVDGVRAQRSDRISVYGYRWGAALPPSPRPEAVGWLIDELKQRAHLVLIDGIDDPAARLAPPASVDARVLVAEPTVSGARRCARALALPGRGAPAVLVLNDTRGIGRRTAARALRDAGVTQKPDLTVPFARAAPSLADRGWPQDRLPPPLRKPAAALAELALAAPAARAQQAA